MRAAASGAFVISSSQCELDGLLGMPPSALTIGAAWRWSGEAVRVDGANDVLVLEGAIGRDALRARAARSARRLAGEELAASTGHDPDPDSRLFDGAFDVTDGVTRYSVTMIERDRPEGTLLMFRGRIPPPDRDLWVVSIQSQTVNRNLSSDGAGVICFTPGTRIATATGAVPVEELREGDRILTKDNGPQELVWIGGRHISGARLYAMPELRPVRLRASALGVDVPDDELIVSPGHRIVVRGPAARRLFNEDEVLAAARDLVNDHSILIDRRLREVSYIHLMLDAHQIVFANGVETESFHPGGDAMDRLADDQRRRLIGAIPELARHRDAYGGFARRQLSAAEAAILHHGTL